MVPVRNWRFSESVLRVAGDLWMASGPSKGFVVQTGDPWVVDSWSLSETGSIQSHVTLFTNSYSIYPASTSVHDHHFSFLPDSYFCQIAIRRGSFWPSLSLQSLLPQRRLSPTERWTRFGGDTVVGLGRALFGLLERREQLLMSLLTHELGSSFRSQLISTATAL